MSGKDVYINFTVNGISEIDRLQKSIKKTQSDFKALDSLFNKGKVSSQQYSNAVQALNLQEDLLNKELTQQIGLLGSNYSGMVRNTKGIQNFSRATNSAAVSANRLAEAQRLSGKTTNRFGMVAQQFGYQIGDFFVQVQSGTNAVLAFGQQATQLAGLMPGLAGAIVGVGVSIGTMLVGNILRAQGSVAELTAELKELRDEVRELESGGIPVAVLDAYRAAETADIKRIEAVIALAKEEEKLAELRRQYLPENSPLLQAQQNAVLVAQEELDRRVRIREEIGAEIVEYQELVRSREAASQMMEIEAEIGVNALAVMKRAGLDFSKTISETTIEAAKLAQFLRISLEDALSLINARTSVVTQGALKYSGRGSGTEYRGVPTGLKSTTSSTTSRSLKAAARETEQFEKQIERTMQRVSAELRRPWEDLGNTVDSSLEDAFISMVDGTKTVGEAFRTMAADIVRELYRVLVVQRMVAQFGGLVGGTSTPNSTSAGGLGGFFQSIIGNLPFLASGGTAMGGKPYIVGEQGPELFVPGSKGTVLNATQTANAMGGETINITQVYNVNGNGDEYIMGAIKAAAPSITNDAVKAVQRERRRGGTMKQAFG